jgi:RsiW-degrading membrane proteinase PrsW (M82 family)
MLFFFLCGVIISVPLPLFIYQYTDSLLIGLDPFTVALISHVFFAPFIEEFSKAYRSSIATAKPNDPFST